MNAPVRAASCQSSVMSNSDRSPLALIEATLVEDGDQDETPIYNAIAVNGGDSSERRQRIKLGQCPSCGMQTHFTSRFKTPVPLSNEYVLNGRCLQCNPVPIQPSGPDVDPPSAQPYMDPPIPQPYVISEGESQKKRRKGGKKPSFGWPKKLQTIPGDIRNLRPKDSGHPTSRAQMEKSRRKSGLCPKCGKVETHKKANFGRSKKTLTIPNRVYKGICLLCHSLTEAKLELGEPIVLPHESPHPGTARRQQGQVDPPPTRDSGNPQQGNDLLSIVAASGPPAQIGPPTRAPGGSHVGGGMDRAHYQARHQEVALPSHHGNEVRHQEVAFPSQHDDDISAVSLPSAIVFRPGGGHSFDGVEEKREETSQAEDEEEGKSEAGASPANHEYMRRIEEKINRSNDARAGSNQQVGAIAISSDAGAGSNQQVGALASSRKTKKSTEENKIAANAADDRSSAKESRTGQAGDIILDSRGGRVSEDEVVKLSYDTEDGWERIVLEDDIYGTMLQWTRSDADRFAYVRKIQSWGSENDRFSKGRVTLVPPDEGLVDPMITSADGQAIMDHLDILSAQKMDWEEKVQFFRESCNQIRAGLDGHEHLRVRRGSLLTHSVEFVMPLLRNDLHKRWMIEFVGEKGSKVGALAQEWLELVVKEAFDPSFGLWQTDSSNRMRLEIDHASENNCVGHYSHLIYFRFIGRILAKALFEGHQVKCRFTKLLYKIILGWPISLSDLREVDERYYNFLKSLKDLGAGVYHLGLNFSAVEEASGTKASNGPDINVNEKNLPDYINACLKHQTYGRHETQLNMLIIGFYDVMPEPLLSMFDFEELEMLMCGPYAEVPSPLMFSVTEIEEQWKSLEIIAEESLKVFGAETDDLAFETDATPISKYLSRVLWPISSESFVVGLRVDAIDNNNNWLVGSIIEMFDTEEDKSVKVHFDGCSLEWDEIYSINDFTNGRRVCPLYTHAPMLKRVEFIVHHRGKDRDSSSFYLFGHSLQIQCQNEWSVARAGAYILFCLNKVLETYHFKTPSDGRKLSPVERVIGEAKRRQTREVIDGMIKELIETDQTFILSAIEMGKKSKKNKGSLHHYLSAISDSLSMKIDEVLPLLPFEIRVTPAEMPLGTNRKEALFPFTLDHTIANYMNPRNSLVLHWRKERDLVSDQAQRAAEAEELRNQGDAAFNECNLAEAIRLYTGAIELNPSDHQSFANRSATYVRMRDNDNAMKDTMSILLIKPTCPKGYYHKGAALSSLQRYEDALSVYEEGLSKYPSDPALSVASSVAKEICYALNTDEVLPNENSPVEPLAQSKNKEGDELLHSSIDQLIDLEQVMLATAAITIQSIVRSWGCQKELLRKKDRLMADRVAAECNAAIKIQALMRSLTCRRNLIRRKKAEHARKTAAATRIQASVRAWRCQAEFAQANKVNGEGNNEDDESCLDVLEQLAREAAKKLQRRVEFVPRPDGRVPPDAEVLCINPSNPISDLTFRASYWRKDESSVATTASHKPSTTTFIDEDVNSARLNLISMAESTDSMPVQLPPKYIEDIKTETKIGGGYYGKVMLGVDRIVGRHFAIKLIEPLVIEQSLAGLCAGRLESIQKTFRNEINVLTQLRHPNIAPLYGFCMQESSLKNTCLVYELAVNGSLDKFWRDVLGRERLSDPKVRARIAFEVAAVLRYMHEGLDGGAVCYHRDVKSGNVCLAADFSVRVVDCGLSKYVTEPRGSFSSAGPTGTPGYTCPEYLLGGTGFGSACDVFSFGILLCDIITGRASCQQSQHYLTYRRTRHRGLEGDADECVDWGNGHCLKRMAKLASKCMRSTSSDRPKIGEVVQKLQKNLDGFDEGCRRASSESFRCQLSEEIDEIQTGSKNPNKCRICGEVSEKCIQCRGSQRHTHCHNCVERQMLRNINSFKCDGLSCLNNCCDSKPYHDREVAAIVSPNIWNSYSMQRKSGFSLEEVAGSASQRVWNSYQTKQDTAIIETMETRMMNLIEEKFRQMLDLQVKLSAGNGLPCPRLFYLEESDSPSWRHPREWAKNAGSVKLYLYFVCSHSLERVSDECRIKLRYSRAWLKAIAPALNASLDLLTLSLGVSLARDCPLNFLKIRAMDEWTKSLLDNDQRSIIDEAKSRGEHCTDREVDSSLQTLVGNSLSCVAEKAASSNSNWRSELVPVFDSLKREPTFVMSRYASESRYHSVSDMNTAFMPMHTDCVS